MPYAHIEDKREQQHRLRLERKSLFFADKNCLICGRTDRLQLHHRNPSTKIDSWIWLWGEKRRQEELKKWDVLCISCHARLSNKNRLRKELKHGTPYAYKRGCRCVICKANEIKRVKVKYV